MIAFIYTGLSLIAPPAAPSVGDALVQRAIDGERRAFDELYKLHAPAAYRLLARLVRVFFEFLVLMLIALAELDTLWRRAGNALAVRPRR